MSNYLIELIKVYLWFSDTLLYLEKYQKDLVIEKIKLGIDKEFKRLTVKNYNLLVEIE